jgi:hypothetical protein
MAESLARLLQAIRDSATQEAIRKIMTPLYQSTSNQAMSSAGLVIKSATNPVAKSGPAATVFSVNGDLVTLPASTDMPALVGTVQNGKWNVFCFFIDAAGVKTSAMGGQGATLASSSFPDFPANKALIGYIVINPTGTGNFVGGTTPLDDATVIPNAVFVSPVGGFNPNTLAS